MIQNTYIEICGGSKNVAMVVRNNTVYQQTLKKKVPVARVVTANHVPEPQALPGMIEVLDKAQGIEGPKLTVDQHQERLFEKLDLSSLELWSPELVTSTLYGQIPWHVLPGA